MRRDHQTYDFFVGKISPFLLFEMEYHSLSYVVETHKNDPHYNEINPASQVASIGLLAYFEAFCKHQFAAIVNLFPSLILSFSAKRGEPKIDFSTIVSFKGNFEKNIGFILAEQFDFGTAKSINGLFRDLLLVTPFDKDEESKLNDIVYRRNLLVHHAGYYTLKHLKVGSITEDLRIRAFNDAVKIDTKNYYEISDFLFEMAIKINRETVTAVKQQPDFTSLADDDERVKAVTELLKGIYDNIDD